MNLPFSQDTYIPEEVLKLKNKFNISTVIETGTFEGNTTIWFSKNFDNVYTIEVNKEFQDIAVENLKECKNINFYSGDSSEVLNYILPKLRGENIFIFLDAHWGKNPLIGELNAIAFSGIKPILLIHDFKNPNNSELGYDSYPEIIYEFKSIENELIKIYGKDGFNYYYNDKANGLKRGCIYIIPN